jgi:hypothetical protein
VTGCPRPGGADCAVRTLLHLLGVTSPSDRRYLERYLAKPVRESSADEVARIVDLMDVHGTVEFAADEGHGIADAAHDALGRACRLPTTSPSSPGSCPTCSNGPAERRADTVASQSSTTNERNPSRAVRQAVWSNVPSGRSASAAAHPMARA